MSSTVSAPPARPDFSLGSSGGIKEVNVRLRVKKRCVETLGAPRLYSVRRWGYNETPLHAKQSIETYV